MRGTSTVVCRAANEPQSGARIQPTAQAVGTRKKILTSPEGAKDAALNIPNARL